MENNIELSTDRIEEMLQTGEAFEWAKKVVAREELSEEEKAFSKSVDELAQKMWKTGSAVAKDEVSALITRIIEPEVFSYPLEILTTIFNQGDMGEFDMMKVKKSPRNTLIARQSSVRSGNVRKSYIDFTEGQVKEFHLQIETEKPMSDLRRDGAMTIAQLALFAVDEFNNRKFQLTLNYVDTLIGDSGDNVFGGSTLTQTMVEDFLGYVDDNTFDGMGEVVGLSNNMRDICKKKGLDYMSNTSKDAMLKNGVVQVIDNSLLVPVKAGKKTGSGDTLLSQNRVFGFCGKIGEMVNKGEMRSLITYDNNSEKIYIKFTGVEFVICITNPEKIAKLVLV